MQPSNLVIHFSFSIVIFTLSFVGTALLIRYINVFDLPNDRSSHYQKTPRGGGVAISAGFLIGVFIAQVFGKVVPISNYYFVGFFISTFLISAISFYDDVAGVHFKFKLLGHVLGVVLTIVLGIVIDEVRLPILGLIHLGWLSYPFTLLWILGLTNAYNFMDGLDGIAATTAVIAAAFLSYISYSQGSVFVYIVSMSLVASTLGFLVFNWPPAKIFMGDVGSTFLGFTFAVLAVIAARYDRSHTSLFVVPLLLFHFIFDTSLTFFLRILNRENVFQAHRRHIYQLLNRLSLSHLQVNLIYSSLALIQGLIAIWMIDDLGEGRLLIFLPLLGIYSIMAYIIIQRAKSRSLI